VFEASPRPRLHALRRTAADRLLRERIRKSRSTQELQTFEDWDHGWEDMVPVDRWAWREAGRAAAAPLAGTSPRRPQQRGMNGHMRGQPRS
jgi:hypothetical protein